MARSHEPNPAAGAPPAAGGARPASFLGQGTRLDDATVLYGTKWLGIKMVDPDADQDSEAERSARRARVAADVETLGGERAEKAASEKYGKCVLETSYVKCLMGLGIGVPLGVWRKSVVPAVVLGAAGSAWDLADGLRNPVCEGYRKDVDAIKALRAPSNM